MHRCSFCGEPIAAGTVVCRWCGRRQPDAPGAGPKRGPRGGWPAPFAAWSARAARWLGRYNRELKGAGLSLMAVAVLGLVWLTVTRALAQPPAAAAGVPTAMGAPGVTPTAGAELASALTPAITLTLPAATPAPTTLPATAIPTLQPTIAAPATGTPSPTPSGTPTKIPTLSPDALPEAVVKVPRLALRRVPGDPATMGFAWQGSSVKVLGRARGQSWVLAEASSGLQGWIPALPDQLELDVLLAALPVRYFRPATGVIAGQEDLTGAGALVVGGHPTEDTVIIVASDQQTLFAVYLHARQDFALQRVPDGTYTLFRVGGADWDGYEFEAATKHERFEAPFEFKTSPGVYTVWRIDLDPASRQVYTMAAVAPADVPKVVPDTALESPAAEGP